MPKRGQALQMDGSTDLGNMLIVTWLMSSLLMTVVTLVIVVVVDDDDYAYDCDDDYSLGSEISIE
jgi:hypothetical protein